SKRLKTTLLNKPFCSVIFIILACERFELRFFDGGETRNNPSPRVANQKLPFLLCNPKITGELIIQFIEPELPSVRRAKFLAEIYPAPFVEQRIKLLLESKKA